MTGNKMKRMIAAMLCMAMIYTHAAPAFAEGWGGPGPQGGPGAVDEGFVWGTPTPEPTVTPTPEPTATPTPEPTATPTPEPTATPTPEPTATPTPEPTATPTPEPTATPTPEPTATPTPELTATPTPEPTTTPTAVPQQDPGFTGVDAPGEGSGFGKFRMTKNTAPSMENPTYSVTSESAVGAKDGAVGAEVTFSGAKLYVAIYRDGAAINSAELNSSGDKFVFGGLAGGEYQINYAFEGQSELAHYDFVTVKTNVPPPAPQPPQTPEMNKSISYSVTDASDASAKDGAISAQVTFSGADALSMAIYRTDTWEVLDGKTVASGETFTFGGLAAGEYQINYTFEGQSELAHYSVVTVGVKAPAPQPPQTPAMDKNITYSVTEATDASAKDGAISAQVTFSGADALSMAIYRTDTWEVLEGKTVASGETFTFGGLAAGEYQINYAFEGQSELAHYSVVTVGVKGAAPQPPQTPAMDKNITYSVTEATDASAKDGAISAQVTFSGADALNMAIYRTDTWEVLGGKTVASGETFTFGGLAAGEYQINYAFEGQSELAHYSIVTVGVKGAAPQPPQAPAMDKNISYSVTEASDASAKDGAISAQVTFSGADALSMAIYRTDTWEVLDGKTVASGETFTFGGLAAGEYQINYAFEGQSELAHYSVVTVGVKGAAPQPPAPTVSVSYTYTDASAASAADGAVSGVVTYGGGKLHVAIYPKDSTEAVGSAVMENSGESFTFDKLSAGEYLINYAFDGSDTVLWQQSVTIKAAPAPAPVIDVVYAYTDASSAVALDGVIKGTVTVTGGTLPLSVQLVEKKSGVCVRSTSLTASGTAFTFDKLPAGEYLVRYTFSGEETAYKQDAATVSHVQVKAITITSVASGENKLTVKGAAQPGFTIQVSAVPAAKTADVLVVGENGLFESTLAADPGTYTKINVLYVNDVASLVSASGSWVVSAPVAPPSIAVDPVNNLSTTVIVKTGANLNATLTTPDSTQTVKTDANGLAHFSLAHRYLTGQEFTLTVVYGTGSNQVVTAKIKVGSAGEYNDLEYGDYGEAVLRLTTRLHELGYPVSPTKDYNKTVREAVRLFQIANGQEADGEAGDRMHAALFSVSAIPYGANRYPTLVRGDKGLVLIKTLQQRLKDLGYYTIKVDGIFGSGTQRAVREFQAVNGLPVTGKADNATQSLLYSSAAKPSGYGVSGDYTTLSRSGKYKSKVVPLQRRLKALGYYSGNIDGYFGSQTYRAVRNFQSRNGLTVTGVADPYTQRVLYSSSAKAYSGSSSSTGSATGYRLLYWGCRGDAVKRLQQALIDAGYKSIVRKADGIFGQWTYDAVCAYQKNKGLVVDGIAGKNTQNALYGTSY